MATIETQYGSSNQSITCTINSLASAAARESTVVSNTTDKFLDALVQVTVKTHATNASTGDKAVYVYAYGSADGGTTYTDGATGSDAAITPTNPTNLRLIGVINAPTANTTYKGGPWSVGVAFGGVLPEKWGIAVLNSTGQTLNASGNSAFYQGIEASSA